MGFQYVEYKLLEKYIKESIASELKHHGIHEKELRKALRLFYKAHPERATQCRYLLAVIGGIQRSELENKDCILHAAAFYVWNQINVSYQGPLFQVFMSPTNSNLFNSLTTSLSLTRENFPSSKELLDMYSALSKFMRAHVYLDANNPLDGYLDNSQQIFSKKKIKGYNVEKVLVDLLQKINTLDLEQVKLAKEERRTKEPEKKSATQAVGFFAEKISVAKIDLSQVPEGQQQTVICSH